MPEGFFAASKFAPAKRPPAIVARCGECGLYRGCMSPKMPVTGQGRRGVLIVAEAPGEEEDRRGIQLIGDAGQLLRAELHGMGVDLDLDCWKTNVLICRPPDNAAPTKEQIDHCRPNLINTIKELKPTTIILLGGSAIDSLIGYVWGEEPGAVDRWVGWQIPARRPNAYLCPTWHPAHIIREGDEKRNPTLKLWFRKHLRAAFELQGRPWDVPPDYMAGVTIEHDPVAAAALIDKYARHNRPAAIDIEANMLKPDSAKARIVCCAISWGARTVAYPWAGPARDATLRFLLSPALKIASNLQYEHRWFLKEFGVAVENWGGDTMLDGHVLDNRKGIVGLKFQAFARLGQPSYNAHIKKFLEAPDDGTNTPNRIHEIDFTDLLKYNAEDAVYEFHVATKQGLMPCPS